MLIVAALTLIKSGLTTDIAGVLLGAAGVAMNLRWPAAPRIPIMDSEDLGHLEAPSHAPIEPEDYNEAPIAHTPRGSG